MNEKFAHTPGPWIIDHPQDQGLTFGGYHSIRSGSGFFEESCGGFGIQGFMSIQDAQLIAAAPELLEALQGALPFLEKYMEHDGYAAIRAGIARAAIDKATGKTSEAA